MQGKKDIQISDLHCRTDSGKQDLFFSLVDNFNTLYTSNSAEVVEKFYDEVGYRDYLVEWMAQRPHGIDKIIEVEGDKSIVVVIPTRNFNGKNASVCRDVIFKGYQIIFVESGSHNDYYFNFAHNVNVGLKQALKYEPNWIIYSNDDMVYIDPPEVLRSELNNVKRDADIVYTIPPGNYHSYEISINRYNKFARFLSVYGKKFNFLLRGYQIKILEIDFKFGSNIVCDSRKTSLRKIIYNYIGNLRITSSFGIFSHRLVKSLGGSLFDEVFINGYEDIELGIRLEVMEVKKAFINYRIEGLIGTSLGKLGRSKLRSFRDIANKAYFNYKLEKKGLSDDDITEITGTK